VYLLRTAHNRMHPTAVKKFSHFYLISDADATYTEDVSDVFRDRVTRFSTSGFFHKTISPTPLIYGLKPFCIWLQIPEDIGL
jgi:hypothetical protein